MAHFDLGIIGEKLGHGTLLTNVVRKSVDKLFLSFNAINISNKG